MYSSTTTSGTVTFNESLDTKYTVAELLSSLANGGGPITPTSQYPTSMPSYVSDASTGHTGAPPLLTPSTLASIEQEFIELQNVPATTTTSQITQSGFVPPVVTSYSAAQQQHNNMAIKQEYSDLYSDDSSRDDADWMPDSPKRMRADDGSALPTVTSTTTGHRRTGPRGRKADETLTPDELGKRMVRRERNKLAAAKCRQRRVDLTNTLQTETEGLENEQHSLESEITQLQAQKEQLEFLLQAHTPLCNAKDKVATLQVSVGVGMSHVHHAKSGGLSRPTSLPIPSSAHNNITTSAAVYRATVTEATGVPITTPSAGVFNTLGLEAMMDGHTGLTPLTGAPSCASEVQRNSSDGSSPTDALNSPTTLMAL